MLSLIDRIPTITDMFVSLLWFCHTPVLFLPSLFKVYMGSAISWRHTECLQQIGTVLLGAAQEKTVMCRRVFAPIGPILCSVVK